MGQNNEIIVQDEWSLLKQHTAARIALGRTGVSIPAKEMLQFKMAHAHARDAVFSLLDKVVLIDELNKLDLSYIVLQSKAKDRHTYLQRPDFGRRLNDESINILKSLNNNKYDVCINIADGLSAEAVNRHAIPVTAYLIVLLKQKNITVAPVCIIEQGRVAISDETGFLLQSDLSLILIGERPGLSSPDSLGAYLTYAPQPGLTDDSRNCVSNIRPEGLPIKEAAEKIFYLIMEALRLKLSGVELKDNSQTSILIK